MKKKIVSIALAGVMMATAISAFAGCGKQYTVDINWNVDLSKPITLKGCYPFTGINGFGHDDTAQIIEDTTGYKIEYEELGSNGDDDVQKYLANRADFNFMKLDEAQYHPYLENGVLCDLTEILEKTASGRLLYQLINLMDHGWEAVTYTDKEGQKHIYGVPDFGYVSMIDSAMIWNRDHLNQIGFGEKYPDTENGLPETMEQVDWALHECQKKFGTEANNKKYHALGIPGRHSVEIVQLKGAFEMPFQFYLDNDGNIQQYAFSENTTNYTKYLHSLRQADILSSAWQSASSSYLNQNFADELYSCVYVSYWTVMPLINAMVAKGTVAKSMGIENTYENIRNVALGWQLRVRGDGTGGSVVQEKARIEGGTAGVSYYTVIPAYAQDKALYVVDFLAKKLEHFADYYGGTEGVHWKVLSDDEIPAGAPKAADYTPENRAEYTKHEDYSKKIIFLPPYEYSYNKYENVEDVEDNKLVEETMRVTPVEVKKPGMWVQLTDRYIKQINDNSQYCNGTNPIPARVLFHLRETGFDAWQVTTDIDESTILNPMAMCPPMPKWAKVSIRARTALKDGICAAVDTKDDPVKVLNNARQGAKLSYRGYWTDEISAEMTKWYKEVKLSWQ